MRSISESMLRRVMAGEHVNRTPLGYMRTTIWGRRTLVPDKINALIIRDSFERIAFGISVRAALRRATNDGLRNNRRKPLAISSFYQILTNPFYMGMIRFKGQLYAGDHIPLIDERTFREAQKVFVSKSYP